MDFNRRRFFGFAASLPFVVCALASSRAEAATPISIKVRGSGSIDLDDLVRELTKGIEDGRINLKAGRL